MSSGTRRQNRSHGWRPAQLSCSFSLLPLTPCPTSSLLANIYRGGFGEFNGCNVALRRPSLWSADSCMHCVCGGDRTSGRSTTARRVATILEDDLASVLLMAAPSGGNLTWLCILTVQTEFIHLLKLRKPTGDGKFGEEAEGW